MGLETATYVADFVSTNPPSSDLRAQGDDHLRLIKAVLQAQFPLANRPFPIPTTYTKTDDYTILSTHDNATFYADTSVRSHTYFLPTLGVSDAGWQCTIIKSTSDTNFFIIRRAAGGNLNSGQLSLALTRRGIPGVRTVCTWSGAAWFVSRASALPVGSLIEYWGSALPVGFEWPNGQTLGSVAASYPDYNAVFGSGVTPDKRGRVGIPLDNLGGSAAGRLGTVITGTAVGNVGGAETVALTLANLPTGITSSGANSISVTSQNNLIKNASSGINPGAASGTAVYFGGTQGTEISVNASQAISVTSNNTSGTVHSNLQPGIMMSQILLVE